MKMVAVEGKTKTGNDRVILTLTTEEAKVIRKVLSCANQLYTVIEPEYKENKIDALIRKLREVEE